MKIDYADAIRKALVFCIRPKRWLPYFIMDVAFFAVAIALIVNNIPYLMYFFAGVEDMALIGPAASLFFTLIGLFAVWLLLGFWVNGAVVHQGNKEKEFKKSWSVSYHKYLSILAVTAVSGLIAFVASLIPYVGWVFSVFAGIALFFVLQSVVVKDNGFMKAIQDSWHIFRKQPFKIFLIWLSVSAMAGLILAIFAIPLLGLIFNMAVQLAGGGSVSTATFVNFIFELENQFTLFIASIIVFILGMAISRAFTLKAQTEFYNQIKKR